MRLNYTLPWIGTPRKQTLRPRFICRKFTGEGHCRGNYVSRSGQGGELWCSCNRGLWWELWSWDGPSELSRIEAREPNLCTMHQPNVGCRLSPAWGLFWEKQLFYTNSNMSWIQDKFFFCSLHWTYWLVKFIINSTLARKAEDIAVAAGGGVPQI